ncbi:MAG: hypothetical protein IJ306_02765 [Oscillospiraceae bacterium]|nr:hypothetical protein [Oscillospiraceae bacterium]
MNKIISVLLVCLMLVFSGCMAKEPAPSEENSSLPIIESEAPSVSESESSPESEETSSEDYDAILEEWVENLEPMQIFETEKEYPAVILEIFDILMEQEELEVFKSKELFSVDVLGDENAFYVHYLYVTNENIDGHLMIRVHKLESGEFALMARGGGPIDFGLEKSDITLEDITDISSFSYKGTPSVSEIPPASDISKETLDEIVEKSFIIDESSLNSNDSEIKITCAEAALDYMAEILGIEQYGIFTKVSKGNNNQYIRLFESFGEMIPDENTRVENEDGSTYMKFTDSDYYYGDISLSHTNSPEFTDENGNTYYEIGFGLSFEFVEGLFIYDGKNAGYNIIRTGKSVFYAVYPDGTIKVLRYFL